MTLARRKKNRKIPSFTLPSNPVYGSTFGRIMGKYKKGDHVKIEVKDERFGIGEWMWLLVEDSDDDRQLVFGQLDNELRPESVPIS
jgi:hypothetical protein